jgi:hypothetical protein
MSALTRGLEDEEAALHAQAAAELVAYHLMRQTQLLEIIARGQKLAE